MFIIFIAVNLLAVIGLFRIQINPEFNIFMPEVSISEEKKSNLII